MQTTAMETSRKLQHKFLATNWECSYYDTRESVTDTQIAQHDVHTAMSWSAIEIIENFLDLHPHHTIILQILLN